MIVVRKHHCFLNLDRLSKNLPGQLASLVPQSPRGCRALNGASPDVLLRASNVGMPERGRGSDVLFHLHHRSNVG